MIALRDSSFIKNPISNQGIPSQFLLKLQYQISVSKSVAGCKSNIKSNLSSALVNPTSNQGIPSPSWLKFQYQISMSKSAPDYKSNIDQNLPSPDGYEFQYHHFGKNSNIKCACRSLLQTTNQTSIKSSIIRLAKISISNQGIQIPISDWSIFQHQIRKSHRCFRRNPIIKSAWRNLLPTTNATSIRTFYQRLD